MNTTTKTFWMMLAVPAMFALTACTAAPGEEEKPTEEVKAKPVEAPVGTKMKPTCMVNDDATEAICCNTVSCWYVDLRDPYSYR